MVLVIVSSVTPATTDAIAAIQSADDSSEARCFSFAELRYVSQ